MGAKFDLNSVENQKAAKKKAKAMKEADENRGGKIGKDDRMKLKAKKTRILVVQPWSKAGDVVKKVMVHQVWKNRRPIASAACPRIKEGEDCPVCQYGWDLRDKYADSKSKRKQDLHKLFKATTDHYVNAIDMDAKEKKVQICKLPHTAYEALMEELAEDDMSLKDICDLDEGKPMKIIGNGKEGNLRRYKVAKFETTPANLVANNEVEEDAVLDNIHNLDLLQPKASEKKLEEVLTKLKKQALGTDDTEDEEEEDEDEIDNDDEESDDDADGEDDDDSDDDEEEEEEKPSKKKASKKSKPSDDEDEEEEDDEDESDDDDEDDDSDDDEEDEDEEDEDDDITDDDDDDDEDSDDDDEEDEDEEEEEKPVVKKKTSTKKPLKKKK